MEIELVNNKYYKNEDDPQYVWANTKMDELRRKECLCMNCGRKNDVPMYSSCHVAKKIFEEISKKHNMAMMITRCGATDAQGNFLYKPLERKSS